MGVFKEMLIVCIPLNTENVIKGLNFKHKCFVIRFKKMLRGIIIAIKHYEIFKI